MLKTASPTELLQNSFSLDTSELGWDVARRRTAKGKAVGYYYGTVAYSTAVVLWSGNNLGEALIQLPSLT